MILSLNRLFSLITISSTLYFAKFTPISPIYLLVPIFLFISMMKIPSKINSYNLWTIIFLSYVILSIRPTANFGVILNLVLGITCFLILTSLKFNNIILNSWLNKVNAITVTIFILEAIYRIMYPSAPTNEMTYSLMNSDQQFYLYKFNSFMFKDSNTTALFILTILFTNLAINELISKKKNLTNIILVILLLLTFSRAAIFGALIGFVLYKGSNAFKLAVLTIGLLLSFLLDITNDGSLLTKFFILSEFWFAYQAASIEAILFGNGIGMSDKLLGYSAHIFIISVILDLGIVGTVLYFMPFISMYFAGYRKFLLVLTPLMIAGLSYFFYLGFPLMFISFALLSNVEKKCIKN